MIGRFEARGNLIMLIEPDSYPVPVGMFLTEQLATLAAAGMNMFPSRHPDVSVHVEVRKGHVETLIAGTDFRDPRAETAILPAVHVMSRTLSPTGKRLCSCGDYWPCPTGGQ